MSLDYILPSDDKIHTILIFGDIEELRGVSPYYLKNRVNKFSMIMFNKMQEIEMWLMEDMNQDETRQKRLHERHENIRKCTNYIKSLHIVEPTYKELNDICIWGNIKLLQEIPTSYIIKNSRLMFGIMRYKLNEIDSWRYEPDNQDIRTQEDFDQREQNIRECWNYVKSLPWVHIK